MGGLVGVLGMGTKIMVQSWSVERVGCLQLEDAALLLGGLCSGQPVGCGSVDGHLVGLGLGTNRAVQRRSLEFDSTSTWLVSGVL